MANPSQIFESTATSSTVITIHLCTVCCKKFSSKSNLNVHMKTQHNIHINSNIRKTCPICNDKLMSYEELDKHITSSHQLSIQHKNEKFSSMDEFNKWKEDFEKQTKSSYIFLSSFSSKRDNRKTTYYACHRSGFYKPNLNKSDRQRALKLKGSYKINANCPARIKIVKDQDHINVDCVVTHVGHDLDVGKLRLTVSERQMLAGKQLQGIPNNRILKDIGKEFNSDKRISFTTNHDLHNIKRSFNVQSDVIFHDDDAKSLDILINKYQGTVNNPILHYKPYGVDYGSVIGATNFFLVFMNSAQEEMLIKYGSDILMIDSTHGTNPYKIQLTTLMIVDSDFEGFPVAFLWSITQTESIFLTFFSYIKNKVPNLKPKIFMSDDSNAFFNAFVKVFEYTPNKILCDWHVKKNVRENLSKISNIEKRKEVKKIINDLINELDVTTFNTLLATVVKKLLSDSETKAYGQ